MVEFIIPNHEDRLKLFKKVKEKTKLSFNKLPSLLSISRASFFNYYSRNKPIPLEVFKKLEKISGLAIRNYKSFEKERYLRKKINLPVLNESLAEIIGILNGDGHLSKFKYEVNVVLDEKEKEYQNYIKELFKKTTGLIPLHNYMKGAIKIRVYSINFHKYLTKNYNLPIGKKKGKLKIPKKILVNKNFLISYIRGLYDTDGSFYFRRKKEPVLQITNEDSRFLKEIRNALISLGFNVSKGINRIFIYRKEDINKFFRLIKPANSKHLKKHQNYLNLRRG